MLKGHIGLSSAVFPEGTPGPALDAFARAALWQARAHPRPRGPRPKRRERRVSRCRIYSRASVLLIDQVGLDYLHGTGHGVGAALNVHEGPQSISTRYHNTVGLCKGMIVSNEPGYYEAGAFGIRIENLLMLVEQETPHAFNGKRYLGFEPLTHIPIQLSLIDRSLLTTAEAEWIDAYHAKVWERVSPLLEEGCEGWLWLQQATQPLESSPAAAEGAREKVAV